MKSVPNDSVVEVALRNCVGCLAGEPGTQSTLTTRVGSRVYAVFRADRNQGVLLDLATPVILPLLTLQGNSHSSPCRMTVATAVTMFEHSVSSDRSLILAERIRGSLAFPAWPMEGAEGLQKFSDFSKKVRSLPVCSDACCCDLPLEFKRDFLIKLGSLFHRLGGHLVSAKVNSSGTPQFRVAWRDFQTQFVSLVISSVWPIWIFRDMLGSLVYEIAVIDELVGLHDDPGNWTKIVDKTLKAHDNARQLVSQSDEMLQAWTLKNSANLFQ